MTNARFIQIHTLHNYAAALLNRDDSGLAKRLTYGGAIRTRISSQCLKRHWRMADDPHALLRIDGAKAAFRSREIVTRRVLDPLRSVYGDELVDALGPVIQKAVYGDKGEKRDGRQTLLLGEPEINWLTDQAKSIAEAANSSPAEAKKTAENWAKEFKQNIKAMRDSTTLPGGLASALFGRMVTSDVEANIDAAIHVAHSFTVHEEESEDDYFTAVDDLRRMEDDAGADLIQETELNSGLFYGYVVVDVPSLISNLSGDSDMAAKVVHNLLYLIAEVSSGAKLGATAPYSRAAFMLVEAGDRQPRSLAESFHKPVNPCIGEAVGKLDHQLKSLDEAYATGEARRYLYVGNGDFTSAERCNMADLAKWAADVVRSQGTGQ